MRSILLFFVILILASACRKSRIGCTDATSDNYNSEATEDNGCCCTINYGPLDSTAGYTDIISRPFPNAPDTLSLDSMVGLHASLRRIDWTANGPCGCLFENDGGRPAMTGYYSDPRHGPRARHTTDIHWVGWAYLRDSDWNSIAAANGLLVPESGSLLVNYTISFTDFTGTDSLEFSLIDTLHTQFVHPNDSMIQLKWVYDYPFIPDSRISGDLLPCTDYPIDNEPVTILSMSLSFIP